MPTLLQPYRERRSQPRCVGVSARPVSDRAPLAEDFESAENLLAPSSVNFFVVFKSLLSDSDNVKHHSILYSNPLGFKFWVGLMVV